MKKLLLALIMLLCLVSVAAAKTLPAGTQEIDLNGSFDGKSGAGTSIFLSGGWGYFVIDNLQLCVAGAYMRNSYFSLYAPAASAQYNFDIGSNEFVPFAGINIGWGLTDYREGKDLNGFVYGLEAGLKYFLTNNFALNLSVDYDWATDLLFDGHDNNLTANLGLRYFFF